MTASGRGSDRVAMRLLHRHSTSTGLGRCATSAEARTLTGAQRGSVCDASMLCCWRQDGFAVGHPCPRGSPFLLRRLFRARSAAHPPPPAARSRQVVGGCAAPRAVTRSGRSRLAANHPPLYHPSSLVPVPPRDKMESRRTAAYTFSRPLSRLILRTLGGICRSLCCLCPACTPRFRNFA